MEEKTVKKCEIKTKCDVKDCKNNACAYVPSKDKRGKFFICEQCLKKVAQAVVKSSKNTQSGVKTAEK